MQTAEIAHHCHGCSGIVLSSDDAYVEERPPAQPHWWHLSCWESARHGDLINHPPHYTAHPSGVECIEITEHMGFNLGNAIKYIWRADEKGDALSDLEKARWYVDREIERRRKQ